MAGTRRLHRRLAGLICSLALFLSLIICYCGIENEYRKQQSKQLVSSWEELPRPPPFTEQLNVLCTSLSWNTSCPDSGICCSCFPQQVPKPSCAPRGLVRMGRGWLAGRSASGAGDLTPGQWSSLSVVWGLEDQHHQD